MNPRQAQLYNVFENWILINIFGVLDFAFSVLWFWLDIEPFPGEGVRGDNYIMIPRNSKVTALNLPKKSNYLIFEGDAPTVHDFLAFCAFCGEFLFKTTNTINVCVIGNYKRPTSNLQTKLKNIQNLCHLLQNKL